MTPETVSGTTGDSDPCSRARLLASLHEWGERAALPLVFGVFTSGGGEYGLAGMLNGWAIGAAVWLVVQVPSIAQRKQTIAMRRFNLRWQVSSRGRAVWTVLLARFWVQFAQLFAHVGLGLVQKGPKRQTGSNRQTAVPAS